MSVDVQLADQIYTDKKIRVKGNKIKLKGG